MACRVGPTTSPPGASSDQSIGMSTDKINSTLLLMTLPPSTRPHGPAGYSGGPMNRAVKAAASEMAIRGGEDLLRLRE
jgi:hypothetical protein